MIRPEIPADVAAIEAVTIAAFLNAPHTGHVAISPVSISDGTTAWYGLGPISVVPEHQSKGVGSRLMREALDVLRSKGAGGCVVLGEPGYYGRFGFHADSALVLAGVPSEYFQALRLRPSDAHGTVVYHPAFVQ
jgi:putative acetyltransferase